MMRWSPAAPPRPGCPHRRLRRLLLRELPPGLAVGEMITDARGVRVRYVGP